MYNNVVLFIILGIVPIDKILISIDFNVLLIIAGTMALVTLFSESKMPARIADIIINRIRDIRFIIVALSLFAGFVSAFVDNVATVLMIAPIALVLSKKLKISPVMMIVAISISSNLQGAATLVGDTTSILLGSAIDMTFFDFFIYKGHLGLFFIVQIAAIFATIIIYLFVRNIKGRAEAISITEVKDMVPTYLLLLMLILLISASFIPSNQKIDTLNGLICVGVAVVGIIHHIVKNKTTKIVKQVMDDMDFITLGILAGLFIIIAGLEYSGVIGRVANIFIDFSDRRFLLYSMIVWGSVLISAFVDNIPYVATMLPVLGAIASKVPYDMTVFYFGLLIGATLGGNITPIGASANIASLGILRENGHVVKNSEFMKLSVPFTITAVVIGYVLVWFIFS